MLGTWFQLVMKTPEPSKWELSGYDAVLPITEKSNPLTPDINKTDAEQIFQLLGQCDAETFQEEGQAMPTYQRLCSESILTTMVQVAFNPTECHHGAQQMVGAHSMIVFPSFSSLTAACPNKPSFCFPPVPLTLSLFSRSVVASKEGTDSALHGIEELRKVAAGKKRVIVICILVEFSAPFMAGQMDYCMDNPAIYLSVLVGFNPVSMARNYLTEDWSSTFQQIAEQIQKLQEKQEAFVLNSAIGPKGLSGPSWMKGGSTTQILPEALLLASLWPSASQHLRCPLEILQTSDRAHQVTYSQSPKIHKFQHELSKWVMNTLSIGVHVLLGKVLQNMLDLCIRNSILLWWTLGMLQVGNYGMGLSGA
ncbi:LOW QUALITY PROTEIN: glucokinase regulatory protein [Molossus nigricans]